MPLEGSHEIAIRHWIGRSEIHHAVEFLTSDQQIDGADEVRFVNPGNELCTGALPAA